MEVQFRRAMGLPRAALRPQTVLELSGSVVPFYPASLIRMSEAVYSAHITRSKASAGAVWASSRPARMFRWVPILC